MSTSASPIDRIRELGGELFLRGDAIRYRIPADDPEARELLAEIRANRDAIREMLREQESKAPSIEEIKAALPPGVRLVSYRPKAVPFACAPVSVITNAGKFFRVYLADLARRLAKPEGYHCPPRTDILSKLGDGGLELHVDGPDVPNVHGVTITDDDIPF
jgi:hypothetical protein